MGGASALLARAGIHAPQTSPMAHVQAPSAAPAEPSRTIGSAGDLLLDHTEYIEFRAKLHGEIMTWRTKGIDPAGIVDGLKDLDPAVELDSKFGGGGWGGKKGDKKAAVTLILIEKFGAKIIATTPEGEAITIGWREKDKLAEALKALPLSDAERAQAAGAIEGKLTVATLALAGRGVDCEYYKSDWQGKEELRATTLVAPANGNGAAGSAGGGQ